MKWIGLIILLAYVHGVAVMSGVSKCPGCSSAQQGSIISKSRSTLLRVCKVHNTVLPGKRVHFDHCVVSADFTCESCMYSVSILYTVRSMIGLSTCQIMECNELSSGI